MPLHLDCEEGLNLYVIVISFPYFGVADMQWGWATTRFFLAQKQRVMSEVEEEAINNL